MPSRRPGRPLTRRRDRSDHGDLVVELTFKGLGPAYSTTLGPASCFRFHGPGVRHGDTGVAVAEHRDHGWDVAGRHYARFDCPGPVALRFEDETGGASKRLDPVSELWAADGFFYGDGQPVAKFHDETGLWHEIDAGTRWPVLVLTPAG